MHNDLTQLLEASPELRAECAEALRRGLESLAAPLPLRASQWADQHFYLSKGSSYQEGRWHTWPFQRAILDCMGHDDIVTVVVRKPARIGYSKMFLAAVGYFAEHKRRNQIVYQPSDGDAASWCKTELDTMLRDVSVMAHEFPAFMQRNKHNTLEQKTFLSSMLHIQGGKAAKNYRRWTVDVVHLDELDGFDHDIEKEGSPVKLSAKRLEGATFPKHIMGSTPKLKLSSLIDAEHDACALQMQFHVPCPNCDQEHTLQWGGRKVAHGFKFLKADPESVVHICPHCGVGYAQGDYLGVWQRGRWKTQGGTWIDPACRFIAPGGEEIAPPKSVAFSLWTAYSPQATWATIVREFQTGVSAVRRGDHGPMKAWVNTFKGESYEYEGETTDASVLRARAKLEGYRLRLVPRGGMVLLAGVDVQDNRFVIVVFAFGRDDEAWVVDHREMLLDPAQWSSWMQLDTYLGTRFPHEGGQHLAIDMVAVDTGGHFTHQVYRYCMLRETRRVHATKGSSELGKPIIASTPSRQDVNLDGTIVKDGVKLWHVGTDTAKDLLHGRLRLSQPGPGYLHASHELSPRFFEELTAEHRVPQRVSSGNVMRWEKKTSSAQNHVLDCVVLVLFLAYRMKLHQYTDAEWRRLEQALCPPTADLFVPPSGPIEPLPPHDAPNDASNDARAHASAAEPADGPAASPAPASAPPPLDPAPPLWATGRSRRVLSRGVA